MKILIVYGSKHGSTEECSINIKEELEDEHQVDLFNIKGFGQFQISDYDLIIIGSAIYMGMPLKEIGMFININKEVLINNNLCLFTCNCQKGNIALEQMKTAYTEELYNRALLKTEFGGRLSKEKMNFFEKTITKFISKKDKNLDSIDIDKEALVNFINDIKRISI